MTKNQIVNTSVVLSFLILFVGCGSDKVPEPDIDINNYGLNTSENRLAVISALKDPNKVKELYGINLIQYGEWKASQHRELEDIEINLIETKKMLSEYSTCSTCSESQREFLLPLLNKMITSTNQELLGHIDDFEQLIFNSNVDDGDKSTLLFLGFAFRSTVEEAIIQDNLNESASGFWGCFGGRVGGGAGMGMASGFLTGCAVGGINGAAGGTVLFPGVGTIAGVVGGCVIGGLYGAIGGGLFGAAVSAASCLFS
jgi:hypothetical protein